MRRRSTVEASAEFGHGTDEENVFEHGLAQDLLSIYLPIHGTSATGEAIGVYEIYEDAAPIVTAIDGTRLQVLFIVGGTGLGLLLVLFIGFAGSSRLLARQNVLLRSSERRFRSLLQNSADVSMVVNGYGRITYESDTVERVLGYPSSERRRPARFRGGLRGRPAHGHAPRRRGPARAGQRGLDGDAHAPRRRFATLDRGRAAQPDR